MQRYVPTINMGGDYCGMNLASKYGPDSDARASSREWVDADMANARIEQLERELAECREERDDIKASWNSDNDKIDSLCNQIAAEKALADRLRGYYLEAIPALKLTRRNVSLVNDMVNADAAYRKARGL